MNTLTDAEVTAIVKKALETKSDPYQAVADASGLTRTDAKQLTFFTLYSQGQRLCDGQIVPLCDLESLYTRSIAPENWNRKFQSLQADLVDWVREQRDILAVSAADPAALEMLKMDVEEIEVILARHALPVEKGE